MIDVSFATFEAEVMAASLQMPVLVDFWAPWCGPCRTLGPILEKLEAEYAGRFKLVKIQSDEEQQLSAAFGIRSIPTVVLIKDRQLVDGFMGALPESAVREFLDKHVPGEGAIAAEADAGAAGELLEQGDTEAALARLRAALERDPANDDVRAACVRLLIEAAHHDEARAILTEALHREVHPRLFDALACWLDAIAYARQDERGQWSPGQFDAEIARNPRDLPLRFGKAQVLMAAGTWSAAMDELLEIIRRNKAWNDGAARKTCIAILELLTPPPQQPGVAATRGRSASTLLTGETTEPDSPAAELVALYRRKLSMVLN